MICKPTNEEAYIFRHFTCINKNKYTIRINNSTANILHHHSVQLVHFLLNNTRCVIKYHLQTNLYIRNTRNSVKVQKPYRIITYFQHKILSRSSSSKFFIFPETEEEDLINQLLSSITANCLLFPKENNNCSGNHQPGIPQPFKVWNFSICLYIPSMIDKVTNYTILFYYNETSTLSLQ